MKYWKKNWAIYYFVMWAVIAMLAPFIANSSSSEKGISPLIPYSATSIDYNNANSISPFETQQVTSTYYRHWLGTDELGRDVLAQMIHGSRTAFIIGIGVVLVAGLIGIILGGMAGYFGDTSIAFKKSQFFAAAIVLPFYLLAIAVLIPWNIGAVSTFENLGVLTLFTITYLLIIYGFGKVIKSSKRNISFPLDLVVSRVIELIDAIPLLFLLVTLSAIIRPSYFSTILIIASVAWTSIAKYTRGEIIKVKNEKYIESAKALALSNVQIIKKHILPNALGPVLISLAFGMAAAILLEASLSFLGMGIASEEASWGKLIAAARNNYQAWWLAIFPGLAIFITVLASNKLSELFQKHH